MKTVESRNINNKSTVLAQTGSTEKLDSLLNGIGPAIDEGQPLQIITSGCTGKGLTEEKLCVFCPWSVYTLQADPLHSGKEGRTAPQQLG